MSFPDEPYRALCDILGEEHVTRLPVEGDGQVVAGHDPHFGRGQLVNGQHQCGVAGIPGGLPGVLVVHNGPEVIPGPAVLLDDE